MNHIKEKNSLNSNEGFVVALATNNLMEFDSAAAIFVSVVDIEKTTVKEIKFLGNEKHGQFLFILSEEIKIKDLKDCEMKLVFENSLFDYKIWDSINPTVDFSDSTIRTSSIITGKDCRTTCMIRNIPNKYNQVSNDTFSSLIISSKCCLMLLTNLILVILTFCICESTSKTNAMSVMLLSTLCIQSKTNYALICRYILTFYEKFYGKKWTRFNSDKICSLSYAKIQGKKTLIQKFRSSA